MRHFFLLLALAGLAAAQPAATTALEAQIDGYVKLDRFQGSVLVAKGGKILLSKGFGLANEEHDVANKPATKFRLGSITKQFTAVAILQLQEQGKLKVEDSIAKYIPDSPEVWKPVTIAHLLSHTGGVPSYTSMPDFGQHVRDKTTEPLKFIERFKNKPLDFAPGTKFNYSNSGYYLLGIIIEQLSGKSYETYLKENIFSKLDMQDSGYDWDTVILKNRATGYAKGAAPGKHRNADYLDMGQPYAAGSLYSTVEDLYRWDRALYTEKVLATKSLEAAWTPILNNYGYGWNITKAPNGHRIISHNGGINGFSTRMLRVPEDDLCVIVLCNLEFGEPGRLANDLMLLALGLPAPAPTPQK